MVLMKLDNPEFDNDTRVMIKAFYPEEKIVTEAGESIDFTVETSIQDKRIATKVYNEDRTLASAEDYVKESDRKTLRDQLKRQLYNIFSEITGKELPWGTLTGVRPVKIPLSMIEDGKDETEIRDYMKKEYLVSDHKTDLSLAVARRELALLQRLDYTNGYSLYIGIPFCPTTCLYCSFTSYPLGMWREKVDTYLDALIKELTEVADIMKDKITDTIYIGGGTPTTLTAEQLDRLLSEIHKHFKLDSLKEFTVEAGRPDSITMDKLLVLKKHGVTRISINPQTMNQKTLDLIGRRHSVEQVRETFAQAREAGFTNINMDLIVGLPGEVREDVVYTMEEIMKLDPDSITVHSLAIKRAAALNIWRDKYRAYKITNTDEIIDMTADYAAKMGMEPYYLYRQKNMAGNFENVGYAKPGKAGIYNVLIMEEKQPILAAGAGAQTKMVFYQDNRIERVENVKDVSNYIERIDEMIERKRCFFNEECK